LTTAQVAAIETTDLAALNTANVRALTTAGVAALGTDQVQALNTAQVSSLTTVQVAALTTAQVAAIETTDLKAMTTAQIAGLTTAQAAALTTTQVDALTTAEARALTTAGIAALTTDQVQAFTTSQIANLATTQIAAFTTAQVAALATDQFAALTTAQFASMSTTHLAALTTTEVAAFETVDLKVLSTVQIGALRTDAIAAFNTDQVAALTTSQIRALNTDQIHAFTTTEIVALTTAQIQSFTTTQIQALSTDQIAAIETTDIAALTMVQAGAITSTQFAALTTEQTNALTAVSPIVLDLNGDGVHTVSTAHGTQFDPRANGHATPAGWVSRTDGLLGMDRNHDGIINDGTELFGAATVLSSGHRAGDGYTAMRDIDSNHDGKLTATDAAFKDLQVWVDANGDGITGNGELKSLASLGIIEIDLNAKAGTEIDNGNLLGLVSSYKTSDGVSHDMADVWFSKEASGGHATSTTTALVDDGAHQTTVQAASATATGDASSGDAQDKAVATAGASPLGVSVNDLLSDRGHDLLAGHADPAATQATLTVAEVHHDVPLVTVDHTQLIDDKQNNLLI